MKLQLKEMKLIFTRDETHWVKTITDLNGNFIFEERNIIMNPPTKEEFDDWETMTKSLPVFNIVEVERFI